MKRLLQLLVLFLCSSTAFYGQTSNFRVALGPSLTAAESNAHTQLGGVGYTAELSYRYHFRTKAEVCELNHSRTYRILPIYIRPHAGIFSHSLNKFIYGKDGAERQGSMTNQYAYAAVNLGSSSPINILPKWLFSGDVGLGYFYGLSSSYKIGEQKFDAYQGEMARSKGSLGINFGIEAHLLEKNIFFRIDVIAPHLKQINLGNTDYRFAPMVYAFKVGYSF